MGMGRALAAGAASEEEARAKECACAEGLPPEAVFGRCANMDFRRDVTVITEVPFGTAATAAARRRCWRRRRRSTSESNSSSSSELRRRNR